MKGGPELRNNRSDAKRFGIFWHAGANPMNGRWSVTCDCGAAVEKSFPPARGYDLLIKHFRAAGWEIERGANPKCPSCAALSRIRKDLTMKKPDASPEVTAIGGPAPKIARRVFALLDEHFNEAKRLYSPEWSDERIAREVDCHIDVVVKLRREAYGELAEDPEVTRMRAEIDAVRSLVTEQVEAMGKMLGELDRKFDQWAAGRKIAGR